MIIVKEAFPGVPDGETQVKNFAVGDEVTGDLAKVAIAEGWAEQIEEKPVRRRGRQKKGA